MSSPEQIKRFIKNTKINTVPDTNQEVLNELFSELDRAKELTPVKQPNIWRIIMKNPMTKIATAAVLAVGLFIGWQVFSISEVSAAEILADAAQALSKLESVYMKLNIRTLPGDNFELIGPEYDFVVNEIWKELDDTWHGKWRIEKPGRVVIMDGQSSLLLIRPNHVSSGPALNPGFVEWLKSLLYVDEILESEVNLAAEQGSELLLTHHIGPDGLEKFVVTVEAKAQGDYTNDYLKNTSISDSDNRRVYWFDAASKLLEALDVYVHTEDGDVLVLETTEIEYNLKFDPDVFTVQLPEDVITFKPIEKLPDNAKYSQMGPREVAQAFFQACSDENWDEALKFWTMSRFDQQFKLHLGGLEIIEIGEPFKSGNYSGWFVPYEIKLRSGQIREHNLALQKDDDANRFYFDGGL